jgi:hypothetical protein
VNEKSGYSNSLVPHSINVDSFTAGGLSIGAGANATNYVTMSGDRAKFAYGSANGYTAIVAGVGKSIGFASGGTIGSGYLGYVNSNGTWQWGGTLPSPNFAVTSAGAATGASFTASGLPTGCGAVSMRHCTHSADRPNDGGV